MFYLKLNILHFIVIVTVFVTDQKTRKIWPFWHRGQVIWFFLFSKLVPPVDVSLHPVDFSLLPLSTLVPHPIKNIHSMYQTKLITKLQKLKHIIENFCSDIYVKSNQLCFDPGKKVYNNLIALLTFKSNSIFSFHFMSQ